MTAVATFLVTLDALVVSTALSAIRTALNASLEELEWTVTAYVLAFAVLLSIAAALGDRFGRRRIFVAGLAVFAVASAGCALAPDVGWLIAARTVQGVGAALVTPLTLALLGAAIPPDRRPKALGVFVGVSGLAVPVGPLLGGLVVSGISWPWIFWINLPVALALMLLAVTKVDESYGPKAKLDVAGLLLVSAAASSVVWALVRGNTAGWTSAEVLSTVSLGVLLTAGFIWWERRTPEPMLPMHLFGSRAFITGNTAMFFMWGSCLGALFFIAQFLQNGLHFSPLRAGLGLMPWGAMTFIVPQITGVLISRVGERLFMVVGMGLHTAAMAWIAVIAEPTTAYWQMTAPLIMSGVGAAMNLPATQSAVLGAVAAQHVGKASGTFSTMRQLGGAFGLAVVVAAFAATGNYTSSATFSNGFAAAMAACAVLSLAGALAGAVTPQQVKAKPRQPDQPVPAVPVSA